jgi:predicted amidohydrolase
VTGELTVAAAQPRCRPLDLTANVLAHAEAVRSADARVVVFPELSLTGYELEAPAVDASDPALHDLVEACAATGSVAFAGAPVEEDGRRFIATLMIDGDGATVVYRKSHLGGDEVRAHEAGDGPTAVTVDGWRLGMGICKDTGVAAHTEGTAALGVDVYVAGVVHAPDELAEQDSRGLRIAAKCDAYVAFASAAGAAGGDYEATAGESTIWSPAGGVLARATDAPGDVARAVLRPV